MAQLPYFNYLFNDPKLEEEFEQAILKTVPQLFSNMERLRINYDIPWIVAKSIAKKEGRYKMDLISFANNIQTMPSNNSTYAPTHKGKVMLTLHENANGNFTNLLREVREFNKYIHVENFRFNVVWYATYLEESSIFS